MNHFNRENNSSAFTPLMICSWLCNHCGTLSVYNLINFVYETCIWELIPFLMIQLHILLMKHEPKSRFQSSTNIPSNLLCKHLSWNPDNKELTFNAFITFASWNRKKKKEKCYASTGSSSLWKSNAKSKYGIPSHGPVVFFSFPIELKKKKATHGF